MRIVVSLLLYHNPNSSLILRSDPQDRVSKDEASLRSLRRRFLLREVQHLHQHLGRLRAGEGVAAVEDEAGHAVDAERAEEHTSELQSLMRISYAVFCLQKQNQTREGEQAIQYRKSTQPHNSH